MLTTKVTEALDDLGQLAKALKRQAHGIDVAPPARKVLLITEYERTLLAITEAMEVLVDDLVVLDTKIKDMVD